ncbi:NAC domain-containing protein 10-like [Pistacia vera]|uniref:NAC domain-containing protein 10-like n=1 Tax=Pistacia vera TaxID=55513 RepID=UPI001263CF03|nr:NAC domain-containing protein 10-like [Pistacia vera]
MYFFSSRDRKYPKGNRPRRSAADGYWKATGVDLKIKQTDITIGRRKGLVYYQGTHKDSVKTNWIMYEYRLASNTDTSCNKKSQNASTSNTTAPIDMRLDDCVLYRIHKKSRKQRRRTRMMWEVVIDSTSSNPSMQAHYTRAMCQKFSPTRHAPLRQFNVEDRVFLCL